MFKSLLAVVVPVLLAAFVAAQDLTINTPTTGIVLCQPLLLTWSGGTPPYFLSLLPGGQPSATPLKDFGRQTGTSLTWVVDQPTGTSLGLTLRDSTGRTAQSAPFTVTGTDTSCLSSTSGTRTTSGTGTGTGTTTTTAAGTTTTTAPLVTTTKAATPPSTTTGKSTTTTGAASGTPSTTGTSGASSINNYVARSALVGVVGAAVVAIFA